MHQFKQELMEAVHNFKNSGGSTFNLALYTSSASLGAGTTAYTTSNEASGTNYTAKGASLTRVDPSTSGTTALTDFADLTFSNATVTARGHSYLMTVLLVIQQCVLLILVVIKHRLLVISPFSFQLLTHPTRSFASHRI